MGLLGVWQLVGSNDNTTWSDPLSSEFELTTNDQSIPLIVSRYVSNANTYRYYRLFGIIWFDIWRTFLSSRI